MNKKDRKILNLIQQEFPLCPEPYRFIGKKIGIPENEAFERTKRLLKKKVIRRIGAIFDTRKTGWKTTLIAMKVPARRLDEVARIVNSYPGVTHNYARDDEYNLWFTLASPGAGIMNKTIKEIKERTGIREVLNLPAKEIFKLKTDFRI